MISFWVSLKFLKAYTFVLICFGRMEESDAVPKPVVVDPPLYDEAPPSVSAQRRPVVAAAAAARPPVDLVQRIQRALVELRELRNQFNAILREIELGGLFLLLALCFFSLFRL